MRPFGIPFDGSNRLFATQQFLLNEGNALWLTHFTLVSLEYLRFVNRLLETFCALDNCCAITGTYPAYIAGVLNSYYRMRPVVGELYIATTDSAILDNIYRRVRTFEIGTFEFRLTELLEYDNFPDYSIYEIIHEAVTVTVHNTIVDVSVYCGSRSHINFTEFIWKHICVFAAKMYAIICVLLDTRTVLYLIHHRDNSNGWTSDILCAECSEECRLVLQRFVDNCTYGRSCKCNVCLRQPPSLRGFASHTVFNLTFSL